MIEKREEVMISPTGGVPYKRKAHFLKPTVAPIKGPSLKLPSLSPKCKWPLEVGFRGWRRAPPRKWEKWVENMESKYKNVWKKVGIHEAIMASTYKIHRNNELILNLAERWCAETNTFVFPWGEATVTLEDMIVLGGFSVLGGPVSLPVEGKELISIEEELNNVRKNLGRLNKNCYGRWLSMFMTSGGQLEHEAFLSMWLSRYVFPGKHYGRVNEQVFPIAIHLARGTRIALAPAVLANIYRDLGLLKETMAAAALLSGEGGGDSMLALAVWAPFHLVQVWAWERLVVLQPEPNFIKAGEPRMARWHDVKQADDINIRPAIDSAGEAFLWRPYALALDKWSLPLFYREKEEWLPIREGFDEDLESFARCLRACELLGIDCRELYQPHRVAMQFGYDQDLPQWITRSNTIPEMAWYNYIRPLGDHANLFLPSRLYEPDVSRRYMDWWRKSVSVPVNGIQGMKRRQRSTTRSRTVKHKNQLFIKNVPDVPPGFPPKCNANQLVVKNEPDVPPGFPPKGNAMKEDKQTSDLPQCTSSQSYRTKTLQQPVKIKTEPEPDAPPGFSPKRKRFEENSSTPVVVLQKHSKRYSDEERSPEPGFPPTQKVAEENLCSSGVIFQMCTNGRGSEEKLSSKDNPSLQNQFQNLSPSTAGTEAVRRSNALENLDKQKSKHEAAGGQSNASAENVRECGIENSDPTLVQDEEHKTSSSSFELPSFVDLNARISRIESFLTGLQKKRSI